MRTHARRFAGALGKGLRRPRLAETKSAINAEKSDIFDVLAYVAFALAPLTRREQADASKGPIAEHYDEKLQAFLDFVLAQYVSQGVEELDQEKLGALIALKYGSTHEAAAELGGVGSTILIRSSGSSNTFMRLGKPEAIDMRGLARTDQRPTSARCRAWIGMTSPPFQFVEPIRPKGHKLDVARPKTPHARRLGGTELPSICAN